VLLGDRLEPHELPLQCDVWAQGFAKAVIGNVRFVQNLRQYRVPFRDLGTCALASHDEPT
jgi:hypothetical protein